MKTILVLDAEKYGTTFILRRTFVPRAPHFVLQTAHYRCGSNQRSLLIVFFGWNTILLDFTSFCRETPNSTLNF
jgi:hypothetical protein